MFEILGKLHKHGKNKDNVLLHHVVTYCEMFHKNYELVCIDLSIKCLSNATFGEKKSTFLDMRARKARRYHFR